MNEQEQIAMDELIKGRTRRTFQLANYCIANIAAYRVNWKTVENKRIPRVGNDFWVRANGTLFDMSVIEWCKLFADHKGKHHWSKTFSSNNQWKIHLLKNLEMTDDEFEEELQKIKGYRDKYAAHLDVPKSMNYPLTEFMLRSASYLYNSIKNDKETRLHIGTVYDSAENFYARLMDDYNQEIEFRLQKERNQ